MSRPLPIEDRPGDVLSVAVIGNDTVLAALPAHPVQLAHGCHLLGYHTVVPASWGDELVASAVLQEVRRRGRRPAIVCACERARARLTTGDGALDPFLISTASPPVAAARYLRQLLPDRHLDITFVGDCASGRDPVFDARFAPDVFLVRLRSAGIILTDLPTHFENIVPPDRRRFASLPGGCPSADALGRCCPERQLVELTEHGFAVDLADRLVAQEPALLDVALGVGCSCTGVRSPGSPRTARVAVTSLEPPRSRLPILENDALLASATSIEALHGRMLLARDPDPIQEPAGEAPTSPLGEVEVANPLEAVLEELEPFQQERLVLDVPMAEEELEVALRHAASEYEPARLTAPRPSRSVRPYAVTPPRALRAIRDRPGFEVPRLNLAVRSASGRLSATAMLELPDTDSRLDAPAAIRVHTEEPPSFSAREPERARAVAFHSPPPSPPPFLTEDPIATVQRTAQARMTSHVRRVPPPAPPRSVLSRAVFWTIIALTIFTLAVLSAARGH